VQKLPRIPAIEDVSFRVAPGEIVGFLGPNGAGKSTTVKIITGMLRPNDGRVLFEVSDIRNDMVAFRALLGYVPEEAYLYNYLSGLEYLQLVGRLRGLNEPLIEAKATGLLKLLHLESWQYSPISSYSKGMCQRVLIAAVLLRVPRYRIYLVLYGGVGLSVVVASILRFTVAHQTVRISISVDGMRAALGIVAFWTVAGLRMAFVSSGNLQGNWVFRIVQGRPPHFRSAMEQLLAAKVRGFLCAIAVTLELCLASRAFAPPELVTWPATTAQILVAGGMCLLLTDVFFLNVTIVAFTGEPAGAQSNLAFTVLKYYTFFPLVAWLPHVLEPWMESSVCRFAIAKSSGNTPAWLPSRKTKRSFP
jgi:ABC-type Na+ transport system ATPase subunit NatA